MTRKEIHSRIHYYSTLLLVFSLPIAQMRQLFIIFLVLNWLAEGDFREKFRILAKSRLALLFILFYLIHVAGLLYTSNMDSGLFDIQMKMTMLIFPVLYVTRPIERKQLYFVFYSLIAGGIVASIIMIGQAAITYFSTGENHFFYEQFSILVHPSYLSMYLNVAIAWLLLGLLDRASSGRTVSAFWSILIILFFTLIIFLLLSKLGILTLMLLYFGAIVYYVITRKRYTSGFLFLGLLLLVTTLAIRFVPAISGRVRGALTALSTDHTDPSNAESTAVRMLVWKASNVIIADNPVIGVGTGDAKDELMQEYRNEGLTGALLNNLNCHNEYYQVFVTLGILGFGVFILHLLLPIRLAYRKGNLIYVLFMIIVMFNFLTESMLETQAGVLFFALFNSILCFRHSEDKKPVISNI